jgi:hypothetical protein
MELGTMTDARWVEARALARAVEELRKKKPRSDDEERELERRRARFHETFPELATAELVDRDYATWNEKQRALVQSLLVGRRFRLALSAKTKEGHPILLTHASVTRRDLVFAGSPVETDALAVEAALQLVFDSAVAHASEKWARGELAELDLGALHVAGRRGKEGGGLLYHRPVAPLRKEEDTLAPRKYDPLDLPVLVQACGHTGHKKSLKDLRDHSTPAARSFLRGGLRTLSVTGDSIRYDAGIVPGGERVLYMIDAEMNYVWHDAYPVLELAAE